MSKKKSIALWLVVTAIVIAVLVPVVDRARTAAAQKRRLEALGDLATVISEAERANTAHDIVFERRVLERAAGLPGTSEEAAEIERRLAVLDWKYEARFDAARDRLRNATDGVEPEEAWLALARMEQAARDYDAAAAAADRALQVATSAEATRRGRLAFGRAIIEKSIEARFEAEPVDERLNEAFDHVESLVRAEPGLIEASRRMLQASLMLDRGSAALDAWRSYFHVVPGGPVPDAIADAGTRLERLLPELGPHASSELRAELAAALSDSRMFSEAVLVAPDAATLRPIVAYARLVRSWREITDGYYRLTALGEGSKSNYRKQLEHVALRFFEEAGLTDALNGADPLDSLEAVARGEFGAEVRFGRTAGYYNLHMGHIVVDRRRTVEQYGQSADVRFIMLDNIVSNGFQSWAWESGAQHGGWGDTNLIVQIRPVYVESPLKDWRKLDEPQARRESREEMERESVRDEARAAEDPYGYLPGLALRLTDQGRTRLVERLRSDGLAGDELRMGFVAELERVVQESSIFAHEGRHAIDAGSGRSMRTWEKEFNAKLSEVAFAPEPRLALNAIFNSNIGSDTPHGRANAQIMEKIVDWMDRRRAEIAGLDAGRPLLPQFDLLSDEQIRAVFRSMDSLAG